MIRALCMWSLKISAALYVRHFHFLHTIEEAEVLNQNEFDNFDNYNLNLLLIKRIILRSRKQGSPHAHLMNSIPSRSIEYSQDRQE